MPWKNSETNAADCPTCWVHPKWAAYLRDPANIPPVTVDMTKGTQGLRGHKPPRLRKWDYTNPAHAKYLRDVEAGRVKVEGLKAAFKLADGREWEGGAKVKSGKILPNPRIA
jgi:hypothetical protein